MKIIKLEDPKIFDAVIEVLNRGELVIFPSETCYGVAVDATNSKAVEKLLEYKKRPEGKAISIAVSDKEMAEKYVNLNSTALNLYAKFLPGEVTVVSESLGQIDPNLESEKGTLGVRIPNYKFLLELISKFGKPITATSANSAGKKTPYTIQDVLDNISEKQKALISLIIDAGELPHNSPTTVIDTTTESLTLYRKGRMDPTQTSIVETKITNSTEETINLGEEFMQANLKNLENESLVILLSGELGVGKTQFTKGLARGIGLTKVIKSPTYNYVNEYKLENSNKFYHMDAWRIQSKEDLELLGFKKWFTKGNIIVIEWPSVAMNLDEEFFDQISYFYIDFISLASDKREIRIYSK